jgi:hypothetical protein
MIKYFVLVLIGFVSHMKCAFGQDTLNFDSRVKFNQYIGYSFTDASNQLTPHLRNKVDSVFKTYDFNGEEYPCEYGFHVLLELDACGVIDTCSPGRGITEIGRFPEFINEVCLAVANSDAQLPNKVILQDSTYIFQKTIFTFEISCEPDEVIFIDFSDERLIGNKVLIFKEEKNTIIFSGFKKGCE